MRRIYSFTRGFFACIENVELFSAPLRAHCPLYFHLESLSFVLWRAIVLYDHHQVGTCFNRSCAGNCIGIAATIRHHQGYRSLARRAIQVADVNARPYGVITKTNPQSGALGLKKRATRRSVVAKGMNPLVCFNEFG